MDLSTEVAISTMSDAPVALKSTIAQNVKTETSGSITVYRYGLRDTESLSELQELISAIVATLAT